MEKNEEQEFVNYLKNKYKDLSQDKIKELKDSGQLEKDYQEFRKKKTQKAEHGAKLQYLKNLKNQCAEDEELYYYKKGGMVGCGCKKKMEEGGPVKKQNSVDKFKSKKQDQATKDSIAANKYNDQEVQTMKPGSYKRNKEGKVQWTPDRTKAPYKKEKGGQVNKGCGGSKMKLEKGNKVCPKCGKIHAAGMGCAVAKFKMHRQGGSLNGIPFYITK